MNKQQKLAFDAGVDYARDTFAWSNKPGFNIDDVDDVAAEIEGCMSDLVGGNEMMAVYAWEGACKVIDEKRKALRKG